MVPVTTPTATTANPAAGQRHRRLRAIVLPACIVLTAALAAWLLLRSPPPARWATLVGADAAVAGAPFLATVTLQSPLSGGWIGVDLHGADAQDQGLGCVGSSESQRLDPRTPTYHFAVPLAADPAIAEVWALVVLSSGGDWESRTMMATSEPIPVRQDAAAAVRRLLVLHDMVY